jgi:hypothetical protein
MKAVIVVLLTGLLLLVIMLFIIMNFWNKKIIGFLLIWMAKMSLLRRCYRTLSSRHLVRAW